MFDAFTGGDATLNIRWLTAADPVFFEVLNRPDADITVRQLVLAKAIDSLNLSLGYQNNFPFVVQPQVGSGTTAVDVPLQWIWDFHASMPKKWENLRLAKIKRISGDNSTTLGYDGWIRLIFTANVENDSTEVAIFSADYHIDSSLTYQLVRLAVVDSSEEATPISVSESETVAGFMTFRTMDTSLTNVAAFLDLVEPPSDTTDANGDGYFDSPATYEIVDNVPGGQIPQDDYSLTALSHGTGLMTDSSLNSIPPLDSDIQTWIQSFNYPFDADANLTSTAGIQIPTGIFSEFDITAPAGDLPTGDTSGLFFPVWITRIERVDTGGTQLRFYFATYNVTDTAPSTTPIEFATLDLLTSYAADEIVSIVPIDNLKLQSGSDADNFNQHFGRGHVKLSSLWDRTTSEIDDFFDAFDVIIDDPADTFFSMGSTRIGSFGVSRVPKYVPTAGESQALAGSTSRRVIPLNPNTDNRYVTELDQGLGNQVDLESQSGISPNTNIDRYGHQGSLAHKVVRLVINADGLGDDSSFYADEVLPRLTILLGRSPQFGDFWYNGTRLMFFNGDTWQG